ncbi:hypothetical protein V9K97_11340 [Variovorax sp. CCNWLW186]|uniref:hypothetical protein n=1 Tax=Variovorax sp. CCNWLW186 TaxID=3127473 RepID=UPI003076997C
MSLVATNFSHASVERLCDYELPDPVAQAAPTANPLPEPTGAENLALTWWLWADEVGKSMLRHYDSWREQHLGQSPQHRPRADQ